MEQTNRVDAADLRQTLTQLRRNWWLVAAFVVLGLGVGLWTTRGLVPTYRAEGQVLVTGDPVDDVEVIERGLSFESYRAIENEVRLMESTRVRDHVEAETGRTIPVDASTTGDDDVITIAIEGPDAEQVAVDVNDFATAFTALRADDARAALSGEGAQAQASLARYESELEALTRDLIRQDRITGGVLTGERAAAQERVQSLETLISSTQLELDAIGRDLETTTGGVSVITVASTPSRPMSANASQQVAMTTMIGLLLGIGAAFVRMQLDDRIRTRADVPGGRDVPVLGDIPGLPGRSAELCLAQKGPAAEAFRQLTTTLDHAMLNDRQIVLLVTSPEVADGKSTVAANLAVAFGAAGRRVALVDADLRRPRLNHLMGSADISGLSDALAGKVGAEDIGVQWLSPNVMVVPAGEASVVASDLLRSERLAKVFRVLRNDFEVVIVDSPPVLPVADAGIIATEVDAVVMVVRSRKTHRSAAAEAIDELGAGGADVVGTVVNDVRGSRRSRYAERLYHSNV